MQDHLYKDVDTLRGTHKKLLFWLNRLHHRRVVWGLLSTPQNTWIEHNTRWRHMKMDTFEKLKTFQISAVQSPWNVLKFLKIFPKMGFSLLMTQMKSKNFNFDRVWAMSIVKYIFFSISTEKWQKKVQKFFIQSAAAAVLKKILKLIRNLIFLHVLI